MYYRQMRLPKAHSPEQLQPHTADDGQYFWDDVNGVGERSPLCRPLKTNEAQTMRSCVRSGSYTRTVAMHSSMLWRDACGFGPECYQDIAQFIVRRPRSLHCASLSDGAEQDNRRGRTELSIIVGICGQRTHLTFHLRSQCLSALDCAIKVKPAVLEANKP
ncbi:hypothetical protein BD309DRAFT_630931 [Dichomitus squalens]|nr:hypothetical protein BD309DRAFT_630931 [Dichomitus squalens]